jgi:hypothetical protein
VVEETDDGAKKEEKKKEEFRGLRWFYSLLRQTSVRPVG